MRPPPRRPRLLLSIVTTVLMLVLLAAACSVVAAEVLRTWRNYFVHLHTECNMNPQQIFDFLTDPSGYTPASLRSIYRIIEAYTRYGTVLMRRDTPEMRARSMTGEHVTELLKIVLEQPDLYLDEIRRRLHRRTGVLYSDPHVELMLLRRGYTWKVLARLAAQRDARARLDFRSVISTFDPRCLLFIDESHHDRKNTRRSRGRARRGMTPSVSEVLGGGDVRFSLLAAMNSSGFVLSACRIIEKRGVKQRDFMAWVREALCGLDEAGDPIGGRYPATGQRRVPSLLQRYSVYNPVPNSILVLDNASIHHSQEFLSLIATTGALVYYLPPYGPGSFSCSSRPHARPHHSPLFSSARLTGGVLLVACLLRHTRFQSDRAWLQRSQSLAETSTRRGELGPCAALHPRLAALQHDTKSSKVVP